jgi:hypothetical protein
MATETFTDDVEILGSEDETQLVVRGHSTQNNPLQEWQDNGATGLAQVTEDGRLRVGGDLSLSAPSAMVEANREIDLPSMEPKQGIQSRGVIDGGANEITESLAWGVQELELQGTGGVDGLHVAQRAELTQANTGDADMAELRAGDFAAINQGGSSQTPVGQATGLHGAVENEDGAYLSKAVGVEARISNGTSGDIADASAFEVAPPSDAGTIDKLYGLKVPDLTEGQTNNYAIHTGQGLAHFGDVIELVEQATPPGTPPSGQVYVYPKADGKLYAKDDTGTEYNLTAGSGGGAEQLTDLSDVSGAAQTANFIMAAGDGSSGGDYRGRALVAADIPIIPASKISGATFAAGAYTHEAATTSAVPLTVKTTDGDIANAVFEAVDGNGDILLSILANGDVVTDKDSDSLTFLGVGAGASNTVTGSGSEGLNNTFVGNNAGEANTTGEANTVLGQAALEDNTTGSNNTALGRKALAHNTEGDDNTAVGEDALSSNTTGNNNTAVGEDALAANSGGHDNTAVGEDALTSNTNGDKNTGVGEDALLSNTVGDNNSALGVAAGFSNVSGSGNVFLGYQAGYNETGDDTLYIENSSSGSPLIYGEFDNDLLRVYGELELDEAEEIAANQTDDYAAVLRLDPNYHADSASSFTITRHNYIEAQNVSAVNDGAGNLTVTDAALVRFDAAAGTHKALDSGTTKSTPGSVDAWVKVNINGTIYYLPAYTSKTA